MYRKASTYSRHLGFELRHLLLKLVSASVGRDEPALELGHLSLRHGRFLARGRASSGLGSLSTERLNLSTGSLKRGLVLGKSTLELGLASAVHTILLVELADLGLGDLELLGQRLFVLARLGVLALPGVGVGLGLAASLLELLLETEDTVLEVFDLRSEGLVVNLGSGRLARGSVRVGWGGCLGLEVFVGLVQLVGKLANSLLVRKRLGFVELDDLLCSQLATTHSLQTVL